MNDVLGQDCIHCGKSIDLLADNYVKVSVTRIIPTEYRKKRELVTFYHEGCHQIPEYEIT